MGKQLYSFLGLRFDIDAAIEMASNRNADSCHPSELMAFIPKPKPEDKIDKIEALNPIDEAYAAKTTNRDPLIFATACYQNGDTFNLLIDGSHRLFKAIYLDESDSIDLVVLSVEDSLKLAHGPMTTFMEQYLERESA